MKVGSCEVTVTTNIAKIIVKVIVDKPIEIITAFEMENRAYETKIDIDFLKFTPSYVEKNLLLLNSGYDDHRACLNLPATPDPWPFGDMELWDDS